MDLIRAGDHHFYVSKPGFQRQPGRPILWLCLMLFSALFLYAALIVIAGGVMTPPVIRVVKSDTWYTVDPAQTSHFTGFRTPQGPKLRNLGRLGAKQARKAPSAAGLSQAHVQGSHPRKAEPRHPQPMKRVVR